MRYHSIHALLFIAVNDILQFLTEVQLFKKPSTHVLLQAVVQIIKKHPCLNDLRTNKTKQQEDIFSTPKQMIHVYMKNFKRRRVNKYI